MSIIVLILIIMDTTQEGPTKVQLPMFDEFILYLQSNNYSPETVYNYELDLLTFTNFLNLEIKKSFSDFKKADVEQYKAYLSSVDRKTATLGAEAEIRLQSGSINRLLSSLRSYLKFLIFHDYDIPVQPENITLVRKEKKHYKIAGFDEITRLIESPTELEKNPVVGARNRAMLELLFATGMRISELLSLNKRDIDFSGKVFIMGKGRKERFAYLTPRSLHYIQEYLRLRDDSQQALFVPQKGRRMGSKNCRISPNYLQAKIKFYREKIGIVVPTSAHSLRHGFATYLAQEGASPAAIQILLGHESLNTTTRYVNVSDKFAEDAHRQFHPLSTEPDDEVKS